MTPRPTLFVSAVSKELRSSRQLVVNTLQFLGYDPIWQDTFGTEQGDLRAMLRRKVDSSQGVVQLVGRCYGAEPLEPDEKFGRVSYTQYEALYARSRGKKVWYLFLDDAFAPDDHEAESEELQALQSAYRNKVKSDLHLFHPLNSREALEASVLKLRDDLAHLRSGVKRWAAAILLLLASMVAAMGLIYQHQVRESERQAQAQSQAREEQHRHDLAQQEEQKIRDAEEKRRYEEQKQRDEDQKKRELELKARNEEMMSKMRVIIANFPETKNRIRAEQPAKNDAELEQLTYAELSPKAGMDSTQLQKQLPQVAEKDRQDTSLPTYDRALAAYVTKAYAEAEQLASLAANEARQAGNGQEIKALQLAGMSADASINYGSALQHFQAAEKLADRARAPLEWAAIQRNIASVLNEQGQYQNAEIITRAALSEYQKGRSEDDKDVLSLRHLLANTLANEGNYSQAETEYRDVILLREKVFGVDNPDTLKSRMGLAAALHSQGKYKEAEAEFREVSVRQEKLLGAEHPDTITSRMGLAMAILFRDKNAADQEKLFRDLLALKGKLLGAEHPETLQGRMGLALILHLKGAFGEAQNEYLQVCAIQSKILGAEHPDTLKCRARIANELLAEGKFTDAEAEYRQVLALRAKVLGPEHPDTLKCRSSLANVLLAEEKLDLALVEFRDVLALQQKLLGMGHPDTLNSRMGLANVLTRQNNFAEAELEYRELLKLRERVLGVDNRDTLKTLNNLAYCLERESRVSEAIELAQRAVSGAQKVLGPNHPDTLRYKKYLNALKP